MQPGCSFVHVLGCSPTTSERWERIATHTATAGKHTYTAGRVSRVVFCASYIHTLHTPLLLLFPVLPPHPADSKPKHKMGQSWSYSKNSCAVVLDQPTALSGEALSGVVVLNVVEAFDCSVVQLKVGRFELFSRSCHTHQ